jgi:hypothetical protein
MTTTTVMSDETPWAPAAAAVLTVPLPFCTAAGDRAARDRQHAVCNAHSMLRARPAVAHRPSCRNRRRVTETNYT